MFRPNLDPTNDALRWEPQGGCNYAVLAGRVPLNNAGVIHGLDSILVIDSLISPQRAIQLLELIKKYLKLPIRYLINTNYHGDHTFGNSSFPADCEIVAHTFTKSAMNDFYKEQLLISTTLGENKNLLHDMKWRRPSLVFDHNITVNLGSQDVHLFHFGEGNTSGDVCVYDPRACVLFTGNLVVGEGLIPNLGEPSLNAYYTTLENLHNKKLDIKKIIPGHGVPCGREQIFSHLKYFDFLGSSSDVVIGSENDAWNLAKLSLKKFVDESGNKEISANAEICVQIHLSNLRKLKKLTVSSSLERLTTCGAMYEGS